MRIKARLSLLLLLVSFCLPIHAINENVYFQHLSTVDGISNNQVNAILMDSRGFMWFGTYSGLDKYDGYRFRHYFFDQSSHYGLADSFIEDLKEDYDGNILIRTNKGFSLYDYKKMLIYKDTTEILHNYGLDYGYILQMFVDNDKNVWIQTVNEGLYMINKKKNIKILFGNKEYNLPPDRLTGLVQKRDKVVFITTKGHLIAINPKTKKIAWRNDFIAEKYNDESVYRLYSDIYNNYYIKGRTRNMYYMQGTKKWYYKLEEALKTLGITIPKGEYQIRGVTTLKNGDVWVSLDHEGLLYFNIKTKNVALYKHDKTDPNSIADDSPFIVYVDKNNTVWVGTYKSGISYFFNNTNRMGIINLGDVLSMVEDNDGRIWCTTNENGILKYNPVTGETNHFGMSETHLGSDVVVTSYKAKDGSLWFGTFNGGAAHYKDGSFHAYRERGDAELLSDHIWSIQEDNYGTIWFGTLWKGIQSLDPKTGKFTSYTMDNSELNYGYVPSMAIDKHNNLVIGHSSDFTLLNLKTKKFTDYVTARSGKKFTSGLINQLIVDSRGLYWLATASGLNVYDINTDSIYIIPLEEGMSGMLVCSVTEAPNKNVWVTTARSVSNIEVERVDEKQWRFHVTNYGYSDGLQKGQLNMRSLLITKNGNIYIGGQEGVNVINQNTFLNMKSNNRAIFSELILQDKIVDIGDKIDGVEVLKANLNSSRVLKLPYDLNTFVICLASDNPAIHDDVRFKYILEGYDKEWVLMPRGRADLMFTNIPPGEYRLLVKTTNSAGTESDNVDVLKITIDPPFYATWYAYLFYALVFGGLLAYLFYMRQRKHKNRLSIERDRVENEQRREMDDIRLSFFSNMNKELRTPLMLIIRPVMDLIKKEKDLERRKGLFTIYRNSERLLSIVNQLIDMRNIDKQEVDLNLKTGDVVSFVTSVCNSYVMLNNTIVKLEVTSEITSLRMSFDEDKLSRMLNSLLDFSFNNMNDLITKRNKDDSISGDVELEDDAVKVYIKIENLSEEDSKSEEVDTDDDNYLLICIKDSGNKIPEKRRTHLFEKFYTYTDEDGETKNTGVQMSIANDYAGMHGGHIEAVDTEDGNEVIAYLPIAHDSELQSSDDDTLLVIVSDSSRDEQAVTTLSTQSKEYEVLIVDDSPIFLDYMSRELGRNFFVRTASSADEVFAAIREKLPDLILLDIFLPGMSGADLCKKLKQVPYTSKVPIMFMPARAIDERYEERFDVGADDYLLKPYNMDLLATRIENLIKWKGKLSSGEKRMPLLRMMLSPKDKEFKAEAAKYVKEHITDPYLSTEQISSFLGVVFNDFVRRVVSITGHTPSEMITVSKVKNACELMQQSSMSIKEIAFQSGFDKQEDLEQAFYVAYGEPIEEYRKKLNSKDE